MWKIGLVFLLCFAATVALLELDVDDGPESRTPSAGAPPRPAPEDWNGLPAGNRA